MAKENAALPCSPDIVCTACCQDAKKIPAGKAPFYDKKSKNNEGKIERERKKRPTLALQNGVTIWFAAVYGGGEKKNGLQCAKPRA